MENLNQLDVIYCLDGLKMLRKSYAEKRDASKDAIYEGAAGDYLYYDRMVDAVTGTIRKMENKMKR